MFRELGNLTLQVYLWSERYHVQTVFSFKRHSEVFFARASRSAAIAEATPNIDGASGMEEISNTVHTEHFDDAHKHTAPGKASLILAAK